MLRGWRRRRAEDVIGIVRADQSASLRFYPVGPDGGWRYNRRHSPLLGRRLLREGRRRAEVVPTVGRDVDWRYCTPVYCWVSLLRRHGACLTPPAPPRDCYCWRRDLNPVLLPWPAAGRVRDAVERHECGVEKVMQPFAPSSSVSCWNNPRSRPQPPSWMKSDNGPRPTPEHRRDQPTRRPEPQLANADIRERIGLSRLGQPPAGAGRASPTSPPGGSHPLSGCRTSLRRPLILGFRGLKGGELCGHRADIDSRGRLRITPEMASDAMKGRASAPRAVPADAGGVLTSTTKEAPHVRVRREAVRRY
jgi:hypothetical protein